MSKDTAMRMLARIEPESETEWRQVAAWYHRLRGMAGDEAAATTHEMMVESIRKGTVNGSSRRR